MWMTVQGILLRFSMEEYTMITGLNPSPMKEDEKLQKAKNNTRLKRNQDWGVQTYKKTTTSLKKNIKAKAQEQQNNKHAFQVKIRIHHSLLLVDMQINYLYFVVKYNYRALDM
ncbi:hypothetical protein L484_005184 [Morus notabilis]|uniref:Uncharacterized protein n=1 Tax=Morus notabilis TaxID=981085 RepID=W9QC22_9ROSA|nr:hypothetical protein L484_005184 [Morus notabilis]